jgi:hypothetical protein
VAFNVCCASKALVSSIHEASWHCNSVATSSNLGNHALPGPCIFKAMITLARLPSVLFDRHGTHPLLAMSCTAADHWFPPAASILALKRFDWNWAKSGFQANQCYGSDFYTCSTAMTISSPRK